MPDKLKPAPCVCCCVNRLSMQAAYSPGDPIIDYHAPASFDCACMAVLLSPPCWWRRSGQTCCSTFQPWSPPGPWHAWVSTSSCSWSMCTQLLYGGITLSMHHHSTIRMQGSGVPGTYSTSDPSWTYMQNGKDRSPCGELDAPACLVDRLQGSKSHMLVSWQHALPARLLSAYTPCQGSRANK